MKIVTREQLMEMPIGTVYQHFQPIIFEGLFIKGETCVWDDRNGDWFETCLTDCIEGDCADGSRVRLLSVPDSKVDTGYVGMELSLDMDIQSRDACFDDTDLFAVWSRDDVKTLVSRLERALVDQLP